MLMASMLGMSWVGANVKENEYVRDEFVGC